MIKRPGFSLALVLALGANVGGCGDDDHEHDEHEHGDVEEEACEHLADGPSQAISAAADAGAELDSAALEHTRVDIALVAVEGGNGGFVDFAVEAAGDYIFFLDADVPMVVFDPQGVEVAIEATESGSEVCDDIAVSHTLELDVGTYVISFGPTEATEVGMVHEEADGHDDHMDHE